MAVNVLDMERSEFQRALERNTVVSANRVSAESDYVLIRCKVTYEDVCSNYWNNAWGWGNWELMAVYQFDRLEDAQKYVKAHRFSDEHLCRRSSGNCAIGFEIWHLVDTYHDRQADLSDVWDILPAEERDFYNELRGEFGNLDIYYDEAAGRIFAADFKQTNSCFAIIASYDKHFTNIVHEWMEFTYAYYGISSMATPINRHRNGTYDIALLLHSDDELTAMTFYLTYCGLGMVQRTHFVLDKVCRFDNFFAFSKVSFGDWPDKLVGFDDDDYATFKEFAESKIADADKDDLDMLRNAGEVD